MNKISNNSIIHAGEELRKYLVGMELDINLEDFSYVNRTVFIDEEKCLEINGWFKLVSMLSCVLMDLGILRDDA